MLCEAASQMAIKVIVLDPMEKCPASALAHQHVVGSYDDSATVEEFGKRCGVLTVEIEHVDVATLEKLEQQGVDCQPKASTIRIIQIDNLESARRAGDMFGYPLMIKSRRLAYDGRGNAVAKSEEQLSSAVNALGGYDRGLYVEQWAPFVKELSVIVARGRDNSIACYPAVETIHRDNICHIVKSPANVSWKIMKLATDVAHRAVRSLEGAGVFAVELFLTEDGQVVWHFPHVFDIFLFYRRNYISLCIYRSLQKHSYFLKLNMFVIVNFLQILLNEVAPRPHNSGHHTIEACFTSQYEQHLRAVVGLPLGDPSMKTPAAVMYNILGEDDGEPGFLLANQLIGRALGIPGASIHWYDKPEMRRQRKMGHITIVGSSMGVVEAQLKVMLNEDSVNDQPAVAPRVGIIMGSDSDLPVMKDAAKILKEFDVHAEVFTINYCTSISISFGSLPIVFTMKYLPKNLVMMQMPRGVPVATVAINNATNAGLLAVRLLGISDINLQARMAQYQEDRRDEVLVKGERLEKVGYEEYLNS
uniref:phosphoribosylaminoimidazole carboxylase n=1 Tax=Solanum tuberosum TaxID=4113 RepID=M0ZKC2_SOLTU